MMIFYPQNNNLSSLIIKDTQKASLMKLHGHQVILLVIKVIMKVTLETSSQGINCHQSEKHCQVSTVEINM